MTLPCQRDLFDIPADIAYFNCAYMSPLPRRSVEAGERGLGRKARPWEIRPPHFFDESERARELFAQLLFSYKLNARTVFFLGYSGNGASLTETDFLATDRTVFLKLSYAWLL